MAKQTPSTGTTANDGTGTPLRDAIQMFIDNFNELYALGSPICGSVEAIRNCVKAIELNTGEKGAMFYIGMIVNGTFATPNYTYTVELWMTTTLASVGTLVARYTYTGTSTHTGWEKITLAEYDGSGYSGTMIINWSGMAALATAQADSFAEGGIFAYAVVPTGKAIGDEQVDVITADDTAIDGSKALYVYNHGADPGAAMTTKAVLYTSIKGIMELKNISTYKLTFAGNGTETFDGVAGTVELAAGESMSVVPYDGNFLLKGNFTIIPEV